MTPAPRVHNCMITAGFPAHLLSVIMQLCSSPSREHSCMITGGVEGGR